MSVQLALDLLLVLGLVGLALAAVTARDLFQGGVTFIVFGLLMALAWARLEAPDLALAEAAIGAGLTGALLLAALARLREQGGSGALPGDGVAGGGLRVVAALGATALTVILGWALASLREAAPGLRPLLDARLHESGVSHPVTAVLLNFRGYDTLLEAGVLVLAVLSVGAFAAPFAPPAPAAATGDPVDGLARLLVPLLILVAGYLLWRGAAAPGGAFQAGALAGAAGVLLALSSRGVQEPAEGARGRFLVALGFGVFLAVGAGVMAAGGAFLEYPGDTAKVLILLVEGAAALSIGVALVVLFVTARSGLPGARR